MALDSERLFKIAGSLGISRDDFESGIQKKYAKFLEKSMDMSLYLTKWGKMPDGSPRNFRLAALEEMALFRDLVGIEPAEESAQQALDFHFENDLIRELSALVNITGLKLDKQEVRKKNMDLLIRGKVEKAVMLADTTGHKILESDVTEAYPLYACSYPTYFSVEVEGLIKWTGYEKIKKLHQATGIQPSHNVLLNTHFGLLQCEQFNELVEFQDSYAKNPDEDFQRGLEENVQEAYSSVFVDNLQVVDRIIEVTGVSWSETCVQKALSNCLREPSLRQAARIMEKTGVQPTEEAIQSAYFTLSEKNDVEGIVRLQEMTGTELLHPDAVQVLYVSFLEKDQLSKVAELYEETGVQPAEGPVQDRHAHYLSERDAEKIQELLNVTKIKPREEDVQELYSNLLLECNIEGFESLRELTGYTPNTDNVQSAQAWHLLHQSAGIALQIAEKTGIMPREPDVQSAYVDMIGRGELHKVIRLKNKTMIKPSENIATVLVNYISND